MKIKDLAKRAIASNIRQARIDAGLTQAEAAKKLGITAQAISNFERGVNNIESSLLLKMCDIYHKSISEITGEQKDPGEEITEVDQQLYELLKQIPEEQKKLFLEMGRVFVNNLNKG